MKARIWLFWMAACCFWLVVLFKMGVWHKTIIPTPGMLPATFDGWSRHPVWQHCFLGQYADGEFAAGKAYVSFTYTYLLAVFACLGPLHWLSGLSYQLLQNALPYLDVFTVLLALGWSTRWEWGAILKKFSPWEWVIAFLSIGVVLTGAVPWVAGLVYNRNNETVVIASVFCAASTWQFRGQRCDRADLAVGLFMALWSPIFVPAWCLSSLFTRNSLDWDRQWMQRLLGIVALGGGNFFLPRLVAHLAGLQASGSGYLYRSGLDGSTAYLSSLWQAVAWPYDPRHWPLGFYSLATLACLAFFVSVVPERRWAACRQLGYLLVPYAATVLLFAQMTSIHPYMTDILLTVPGAFVVAYWSLQESFRSRLNGPLLTGWLLLVGSILMTNLLTVAQNLRA